MPNEFMSRTFEDFLLLLREDSNIIPTYSRLHTYFLWQANGISFWPLVILWKLLATLDSMLDAEKQKQKRKKYLYEGILKLINLHAKFQQKILFHADPLLGQLVHL